MSNIINVKEERNVLTFVGDVFDIVANSSNFYLSFDLDEEWLKCSIITVIFDFDGEKCCVELLEDRTCQIPQTNSSLQSQIQTQNFLQQFFRLMLNQVWVMSLKMN